MRTREEIERDLFRTQDVDTTDVVSTLKLTLILEVLLDIRGLLDRPIRTMPVHNFIEHHQDPSKLLDNLTKDLP